jgi:hypothetical protein
MRQECADFGSSHLGRVPLTKDQAFLAKVRDLLSSRGEVLVLFRYARAAGRKDFALINDLGFFSSRLDALPIDTNVLVYGDPQLPLRGQVDSAFIQRAIESIPEGSEYLIVCTERTIHDYRPHQYWESFEDSAGETHAELVEALNEYRGRPVAVGLWPPWPDESNNTIEAYVPDESGMIRLGPY